MAADYRYNATKRIALNGPDFPESKFTMKSTCYSYSLPRRMFILALLSGAALFGFSPGARAESSFVLTNSTPSPLPRRASIILIVADGLGYGDLSCYGQTKFQTPNLDKVAAEGIRLTSYYAGDAASSPSLAALLTGRDSGRLQQRADVDVPLSADDITVAQVLKQSGYHTGLIGEWDLGGDGTSGSPWNKGFDEFAGYFGDSESGNYYADYIWRHDSKTHLQAKAAVYDNAGGKEGKYIPDLYTTMAMNFAKNNQPDWFNHYQPFFLVVNYKIPGSGGGTVPTDAPYSGESWPQPEKNKAAMITRLDGYIGQLLEQLQKLAHDQQYGDFLHQRHRAAKDGGVDPEFFRSAGPFRGGRGDLYEGGLRVPMIARWPGKIPAGQVSDLACAAWDFLPTAADIALIHSPTNIDGISFLPTLLGQKQASQHEFFSWSFAAATCGTAVRMDNWAVVQPKADAPPELYDLKTDRAKPTTSPPKIPT